MVLVALLASLAGQPASSETAPPPAPAAPKVEASAAYFVGSPEKVSEGHMFVEGPTWVREGAGGYFVFCERDREGGTVWKWSGTGKPEAWRKPSGQAIGSAVDAKGNLIQAESETRRITRVPIVDGKPGEPVVVAEAFEGKRLNATNDVVVKSDGSVYFTDPTFFTDAKALELGFLAVFRVSPEGAVTPLDKTLQAPNGLCFSPDEKRLYVNDFRANTIHVFDVRSDGMLENGRVFAELKSDDPKARGRADGIRCDAKGNVYTTGLLGVTVFSPEGVKVGELTVPGASNLAFGGADGTQVLITAGRSVWTIKAVHKGAGW